VVVVVEERRGRREERERKGKRERSEQARSDLTGTRSSSSSALICY